MRYGEQNYTIASSTGELYTVRLAFKRIRSFNIRVASDGSIRASAPCIASDRTVREFLQSRADWIEKAVLKQRSRVEEQQRHENLQNGGYLRVYGRQIFIAVSPGSKPDAVLLQDTLTVTVTCPDDKQEIETAIRAWQHAEAFDYLTKLTLEYLPAFAEYGICKSPAITIKRMKTRWGSCSYNKGRISYNVALLALPDELVRYVVVHELAHFVHHNHQPEFHALVERILPGSRELRRKLKLESIDY